MDEERVIRVLLVHGDSPEGRRLRERLATFFAIQFVWFDRLAPACQRLAEEEFDLILVDLSLPEDPGLDAFIRLNAQDPGVPVVVISSAGTQEAASAALQAGATDSLVRHLIEAEPLDEVLTAIVQRSRFEEAIRKRELLDDASAVYSPDGFHRLAPRHLSLAAWGGKALLVGTFDVAPGSTAQAGAFLKRSFRESDLVARLSPSRFAAVAIVHPDDNSLEVLEARLGEQLREHNVGHEKPLDLRYALTRIRPEVGWGISELLAALPEPERVLA